MIFPQAYYFAREKEGDIKKERLRFTPSSPAKLVTNLTSHELSNMAGEWNKGKVCV